MDIPIIKIEIEGMKEKIQSCLAVHNNEFNTMVHSAVEKAFSVEAIQDKIDRQVEIVLDEAIESLSGDRLIQDALKCFVLNSIVKMNQEQMKS